MSNAPFLKWPNNFVSEHRQHLRDVVFRTLLLEVVFSYHYFEPKNNGVLIS